MSLTLELQEITDRDFEVEVNQSPIPVCVFFYTSYCGSCHGARPSYEVLAKEYEGRVKFVALNTEKGHENAKRFGVTGHPHSVIIQNGGMKNARDYYTGHAFEIARYRAYIDRALGLPYPPGMLFH